ncbi:MAG: hypothetical protein ACJ781_19865 [Myxococcales bacterium]
MDQALAAGWVLAFGMLFAMLLRSRPLAVPVLVGRIGSPPRPRDEEDEEQLPETDRAPRAFPWLPAAVAVTAAVRLCLLAGWQR